MSKNIFYLATFFIATPATIITSLFALHMMVKAEEVEKKISPIEANVISAIEAPRYGSKVYAALPSSIGEVKGVATAQDARYEIVRQYLANYNSPLESHAQFLVDTAEKYNLDFRLLVAIAQQESNLCKKIPENSFNCWGWGIHSRGTLRFMSYEEAIEAVSKGLKENYIDKGLTTPEAIMAKYTPSSNGSWANGVSQFLAEME